MQRHSDYVFRLKIEFVLWPSGKEQVVALVTEINHFCSMSSNRSTGLCRILDELKHGQEIPILASLKNICYSTC